jgi:hypothetical protein
MASGTINFTRSATSGSYIEGKIEWVSTANISDSSSDVTVNIYVKKGSTSETLTIATSGTWTYKLTIDGTTWTGSVSKSVRQDWVYLGSKTVTDIKHGTGGLKSITISGSITAPTETSFAGHSTAGIKEVDLDIITRATVIDSLTCNSTYVTGNITAYYTPRNTGCYNRCIVYVNVGGTLTELQREDLGTKNTTQQSYPIKFDSDALSKIYDKVTNTETAVIQVTFQTYASNVNGVYTTKIGENSRTKELLLPSTIAPTASLKITPVNSNSWIKSQNIYVAGLSGATVELSAKAGEGSELKTKSIFWDDVEYGIAVSSSTINIPSLTKTGNIQVVGMVRDYRGRTATDEESITVLSYSSPVVTSMTAERGTYDNGWTANNDGEDVQVKFKTNLSLGAQGNRYSVAFERNANATTLKVGTTTGLESGKEYTVYLSDIDSEKSHTLKLTATDSVGTVGVATITVQTKHITMEFHESGQGIAFGKTSEEKAFECAMPAKFLEGVNIGGSSLADFVVDQGTSGDWSYRKWNSGRCELYTYHRVTTAISTQEGGICRSQAIELSLPFKVSDITTVFDCSDISVWASSNTFRESGGNSTVKYVLFKGASYASNQWGTHIHIKGKWK